MSITQTASRVRVESAAKNGTLGSQSGAGTKQVILDTNISTNNGNLEASPSLKWRHITLRRGEVDEECQSIQSVEGDGVTCNVYDVWDTAPASGDTYDIAYKLEDVATIAGCDFETDSRQWVMSKKLVIATASTFSYLGMSHGQILRMQDSGPLDSAFDVNDAGRFEIGTIKNDLAERGAIIIFMNDGDSEEVADFKNGSFVRAYESAWISGRSSDGVTGLTITVGATADVGWARVQTHGMVTPPFKQRYRRYKDEDDAVVISVSEIEAMPSNLGWLRDPMAKTITDEISADAAASQVRILIEEAE